MAYPVLDKTSTVLVRQVVKNAAGDEVTSTVETEITIEQLAAIIATLLPPSGG